MKKFSKLFLSCAAVAAVTAAVATSAMAADSLGAIERTSGVSADSISITLPETYANESGQKTLLILAPNYLSDDGKINTDKVLQIDQDAFADQDEEKAGVQVVVPIKKLVEPTADADNDKGTYTVLMGGGKSNKVYTGTFRVGVGSSRLLGDIDGNEVITAIDASAVAKHCAEITTLTGEALQAADADDNGVITVIDASEIAKYCADLTSKVDGDKTISDKNNTVTEQN